MQFILDSSDICNRQKNQYFPQGMVSLLTPSFTVNKALMNESHPNKDANHLQPYSKLNLWEQ